MASSIHEKLERVRKPRVHIKYEVETEGAMLEKELPFVVGVLGDFTGNPAEPLKPFRERKFIQIDRDNFDEVMARMAPGLSLIVDNTLADDGTQMQVKLRFDRLDDFEPAAVVQQVPALAKLFATRNELRDLMTKADRSEDLEVLLERILQDNGQLRRLVDDLERSGGSAAAATPAATPPKTDGAA